MWSVTPSFIAELKSPVHTIAVQVDVLDTDLNVIEGGSMTVSQNIVDGGVDLDVTRANRRTFQMNLLNNNAEFSPGSDIGGLFYVDRAIRIYRGVVYGDNVTELVPVGTFLIDKADVTVERNMSIVTLSGQDLWKKIAKGQFVAPMTYEEGAFINDVIRDIAQRCGVDRMLLDPLLDRSSNQKNLNVKRSYEVGDFMGVELVKLCTDYSLDIYFDPLGRLVTRELDDPLEASEVFLFQPEDSSVLAQLQASWDDDGLYNHVVVTGTGDETVTYVSRLKDEDPDSPTNIRRIGNRVYRYESGVLASQESVDKAARTIFYKNRALSENVRLEAMCNPAFEGNDVVRVFESTYSHVDQKYLLTSFNVPLATSKQTLHMTRALSLNDGTAPVEAEPTTDVVVDVEFLSVSVDTFEIDTTGGEAPSGDEEAGGTTLPLELPVTL